jgi:predicted ArsR family transcriptional regulator
VAMQIIEKMFGNNTHIKVILLFYNNGGYFNNITGLAKILDKSHVTVRKVISDLIDAGVLSELNIGKSRVIKINDHSPYKDILYAFIDSMRGINENKSLEEIIEQRTEQMGSRVERFIAR